MPPLRRSASLPPRLRTSKKKNGNGGGGKGKSELDILSARVTVLEEMVHGLMANWRRVKQKMDTATINQDDCKPPPPQTRSRPRRKNFDGGDVSKKSRNKLSSNERAAIVEDKGDDGVIVKPEEEAKYPVEELMVEIKSEVFDLINYDDDDDGTSYPLDADADNSEDFTGLENDDFLSPPEVKVEPRRSTRARHARDKNVDDVAEDDINDMDVDDKGSDFDYQPDQNLVEEDIQSSDLDSETESKSPKKLINIVSAAIPKSNLPTPYVGLGPKIEPTTAHQLDKKILKHCTATKKPKAKKGSKYKRKYSPSTPRPTRLFCKYCDYSVETRRGHRYTKHLRKHTGERPYICSVCGKGFRGTEYLNSHMKSHDPSKPVYNCDVCFKEFKNPMFLNSHFNRVHKDQRRQCDVCNGIFSSEASLRFHKRRVHEKEIRHICELCGLGYLSISSLKEHLESHSNGTFKGPKSKRPIVVPPSDEKLDLDKVYLVAPRFNCEVEGCGKSFGTQLFLDFHTKKYHMTKDEKRVTCQICLKSFNGDHYKIHMATVHSEERPHICRICGQGFKVKPHLTRHEAGHSNPNWKPRANCKPKTFPSSQVPLDADDFIIGQPSAVLNSNLDLGSANEATFLSSLPSTE